jgi:hypothetical protein
MTFPATDRAALRALAARVAELAARPGEREKETLWRKHNALTATRPLIFCDPENGWNEIVPSSVLTCENELARQWEFSLRKEIFWGAEMNDDRVIRPVFDIPHVYTESDWGMRETRLGGEHGGAYTWEAPLKDFADFDKLRFPVITVDYDQTSRNLTLAQEIFDSILEVRPYTQWWWTLGLTQTYSNLRGLTQMLMDFIAEPQGFHRLMAFLRDGTLARLDFLEQNGLLSPNTGGEYVGSGGFGWLDDIRHCEPEHSEWRSNLHAQQGIAHLHFTERSAVQVLSLKNAPRNDGKTCDMWGFCEAQETSGVSPKMFAEFILPYQIPILERFGLNCYGCCEPLDKRWRYICTIPRLRRVSVSPWANIPKMAEYLGGDYIFSLKPSPIPLATSDFDEDLIRAELREKLSHLKDCRVEIIMKDNHTIANDPRRVIRWVEIAREESAS